MKCHNCQTTFHNAARYCSKCGESLLTKTPFDYNSHIKKISVFFFVLLTYVAAIHFIEFASNYTHILLIDLIFGVIILAFYFIDFKTINKLFSFKGLKISLLIKILIAAPICAIIVSFIADLMNQSLFDKSQLTYYNQFIDSPAPILLSIISIGLFPAIFEEIAFRGIVFNHLTKITGLKSTIFISAILFTILHLSILSALWIFPIGLVFGYFRAKYRSIWYGIVGHLVYNSSIVMLEILNFS
jgi:membrane protease YdiL (CAAX protease family)